MSNASAQHHRAEQQRARITTGVPALDELLGGGIPRGSNIFVSGLPGAGKTVLCEQALFANAQTLQSVLYVTTLSEPPIKTLKFSQAFDFFRPALLEDRVRFADLGSALHSGGPAGALAALTALIEEHRPEFLVIDSFKVFREHFPAIKDFRRFASEIVVLLTAWEITSFLVGEYRFEEIATEPEFAIADGILHLSGTEEMHRQKRYLNVVKMRGMNAFLGRHSYEITEAGMTVYPRMTPWVQSDYVVSSERIGSAIGGLNAMMGGGIPTGSASLISGGTGTGKTLTAISFAVDAARNGIPSLVASFEESPNQLLRNCDELGWDASRLAEAGLLNFLHVSPSELDIDRHALVIRERSFDLDAKLVVVDSISAFEAGMADVSEYLWALSDHFKRKGITHIFTAEAYSFFEAGGAVGERRVSYVADSIVLLRLVEEGDQVRRKVSVLKMRGSDHDSSLHDLHIGADGMRIANGS